MRRGDKSTGAIYMKPLHIHLSPLGGIAGDMFVAAVLDALPELQEPVAKVLQSVLPSDAIATIAAVKSRELSAKRFDLTTSADRAPSHFPDLARRIDQASFDETARSISSQLLRSLAEAEASVHCVPLQQVHFHEIADWDTLADLTAAGFIFSRLEAAGWSLDPLPLGGGQVKTRHGPLQIPAPATARLLQGLPVVDDGIAGERVTPTGAVIAAEVWARSGPRPPGVLGATGYGAGSREIKGISNVLVAQLIEPNFNAVWSGDLVSVLEFDVDDMSGEEIATAADHLRTKRGTIDLTTSPVNGKKGRVSTAFRLLVQPDQEEPVAESCFSQTSTLGLRVRREQRLVLPRRQKSGTPRIKQANRPGGMTTQKAEADDLKDGETLAIRRARAREAET